MSSHIKIFGRPFLHTLTASIVAGLTLQVEWAVDHDFDDFDVRVFSSAVVIFVLLQALRLVLWRVVPHIPGDFDEKYGEFMLLLSIAPVFQLISNALLQIVATVCYLGILVTFGARTLDISWCARLREWAGESLAHLRLLATGRGLRCIVEDDRAGALCIRIHMKDEARPSAVETKKCIELLCQDLPDATGVKEIKVYIDTVDTVNEQLAPLLQFVSHYASLMGIEKVSIVGARKRIERASALVPCGEFAFEPSDSGRAGTR